MEKVEQGLEDGSQKGGGSSRLARVNLFMAGL